MYRSIIVDKIMVRISIDTVTLGEFMRFVESGSYFDERNWEQPSRPLIAGGDELLRRIGFEWKRLAQPVRGLSWYEASAYCKHAGGRLPHAKELSQFSPEKSSRVSPIPEWCSDWYNPYAYGPSARPLDHLNPEKRIHGWDHRSASPYNISGAFGFRVVLP